jgi:TPR repeat protein
VIYANGEGVPKNYTEAAKWYRKAAELGYPEAQYSLGLMYANGEGVPKDFAVAYMWANLASVRGVRHRVKFRDTVKAAMTKEQLAEGQKLAAEWLERKAKEKEE